MASKITTAEVGHIASLAKITLLPGEKEKLAEQFSKTLEVIEKMNGLDTKNVKETTTVTGTFCRLREDDVDVGHILPVDMALSNAREAYNGYFVIPAVFDRKSKKGV